MESGERLSAYLAGELDADETAALEAELAGDPALRARLERVRRAGEALASLPAVEPPADFSARLRDVLRAEIDQRTAEPDVDELAARRIQRNAGMNRFVGIGVAAAAVAVVAGIGVSALLGGADEAGPGDPGVAAMETRSADPLQRFVRVTDADHDEESVQALAEQEGVVTDVPSRVGADEAAQLEASRYEAFGLAGGEDVSSALASPAEPGGAARGGTADGEASGTGPEDDAAIDARQQTLEEHTADPLQDVRRCLPEIVSSATEPVIPLYAEVARFEGEPAIIYLVLTREPGERFFTRIEAWVVGRADCFPRLFQQVRR